MSESDADTARLYARKKAELLLRVGSERRDRIFFSIVVVSIAGALIGLHMYGAVRTQQQSMEASPGTVQNSVSEVMPLSHHASPAESQFGEQPSIFLAPSTRSTQEARRTVEVARVFECVQNGQRILSEQPCGADAKIRTIEAPNTMQAQDTSTLYGRGESRTDPKTYPTQRTRADVTRARRCAAIEAEIDRINASMRQGYSNGESYRQRLRDLSAERWELECRYLKTPAALRN